MKGVTFGSYHSFDDFNLILSQKIIGTPSPKTNVIDIAGGDGVLDLTEYFGDVKYNNRSISFDFSTTVPQAQFMDLFSKVQNALHGQKLRITLDDDPDFYYVGRISVSEWKADKSIGKLTIDCDCEPWKWKHDITRQKVFLYGKNLFDPASYEQGTINNNVGSTFEAEKSPNNTRIRNKKVIYVKPATRYTVTIPNGYDIAIRTFDKNEIMVFTTGWRNGTYSFVASDQTDSIALTIRYTNDARITPAAIANLQFQIEEGYATEYEPFLESNTVNVSLNNLKKKVIPLIKASGRMNITSDGTTIAMDYSSGKYASIVLHEGANAMTITGNGAVVFEYQEGGL